MKKFKLSVLVAIAIAGAAFSAFTPRTITAGWYGQTSDVVPPYNSANLISSGNLSTKCPSGSAHLCAAYLDVNGDLDGSQSPNTVMSAHNFKP